MTGGDVAAILYALASLGELAARGLQQMRKDGLSDAELEDAWRGMRARLDHANLLWERATSTSAARLQEPGASTAEERASL